MIIFIFVYFCLFLCNILQYYCAMKIKMQALNIHDITEKYTYNKKERWVHTWQVVRRAWYDGDADLIAS